jgi:hypothetical protein
MSQEQVAHNGEHQKPRNRTLEALGISIPPARVRKIIDKQGINSVVQKEINFKQELLAYQKDGCQPKSPEYKNFKSAKYEETKKRYKEYEELHKKLHAVEADKSLSKEQKEEEGKKLKEQMEHIKAQDVYVAKLVQISIKSGQKIRFNELVCVGLGILVQHMLTVIINHSIQQVRDDRKKIVGVEHCAGMEKLDIYPFVHTLPALARLKEYNNKLHEFNEKIRRLKAAKAKTGDNVSAKESINNEIQKEKKYSKPQMYPEETPSGVYNEKNELFYYTNNVRKSLKNAYSSSVISDSEKEFNDNVRLSNTYRRFLSELTVEFLKRLCPWFMSFLKMQKLKTINVKTTYQVLKLMSADIGFDFSPIKYMK